MKSTTNHNTETLFDHLCDQMKKLSVKAITVDEAKAQATLVKQANNLLRYELDRAKLKARYKNMEIREIEQRE